MFNYFTNLKPPKNSHTTSKHYRDIILTVRKNRPIFILRTLNNYSLIKVRFEKVKESIAAIVLGLP